MSDFSSDIRKIGRRVNLPQSEALNYFIQGLKPVLRQFVLLKQPKTLEEAEDFARLREMVPENNDIADIRDMLKAIVAESKGETGSITPAVAAVDFPRKSNRGFQAPGQLSRHDIDAIASQLAIKLKGPSPIQGRVPGEQRTVRNRRTTDGRPICNFCG